MTGVDHDGLYINADGTFTNYPVAGPSVLVAAPTGSSILGATNIADDDGYGSGIWTTDLVGDDGFNAAPLPNGFDPDRDFLPDPDYTSRFNGTSAAAPMVSGVIALMLQANPNLTYRDVEEILVRSSRQNAQFEFPSSGVATFATNNTWQTNQIGPYRNPDAYDGMNDHSFIPFDFPIADPNADLFGGGFGFDFLRRIPTTSPGKNPALTNPSRPCLPTAPAIPSAKATASTASRSAMPTASSMPRRPCTWRCIGMS